MKVLFYAPAADGFAIASALQMCDLCDDREFIPVRIGSPLPNFPGEDVSVLSIREVAHIFAREVRARKRKIEESEHRRKLGLQVLATIVAGGLVAITVVPAVIAILG